MKTYKFDVKTIEAGQRQSYGDSFYTYEVSSIEQEWDVKNFEKKDMPNPFAGQLLEFKKITNNNEGKSFFRCKRS